MNANDLLDRLSRDGFVVIPGFYDLETEVAPIQQGIQRIVQLTAAKYGIDAPASTPDEAMKLGYPAIVAVNRAYGGEIYDAIKQIPAFVALVGGRRNAELFTALRPGAMAGVAAGGYGIRIDNPGEAKFRALWHQEFPAQLRSLDGLIFWSPLLPVSQDMGPVGICAGSHKEGLVPVFEDDEPDRSGAYALRLQNEAEIVARYSRVAPLTNPGDVIIMDFLVLHESGHNISRWPRWTMQLRYFNFNDPVGIRIGWKGSFAAGEKFSDILPELVATKAPGPMTNPQICRLCRSALGEPTLDLAAPAMTSANETVDTPTRIFVCNVCGHVQSPEPADLAAYYDTTYRISLDSEDHDQLYEMRDGSPVFRTDRQAEVVLEKTALAEGARVLDYGAAKAQTLRKILARRPDLSPHVFDVSDDYRPFWAAWLKRGSTASYSMPEAWRGSFDLVTSHYVLEHVADPVGALGVLASLLATGGRIFFSVPDWTQNTGDLLVADHVNHFTAASIRRLAQEAGLVIDDLDFTALPSAFAVTCRVGEAATTVSKSDVAATASHARDTAVAFERACDRLDRTFRANAGRTTAVYGAGFYGAFMLARMTGHIEAVCCLDNNRHLWGKTLFGVPVAAPDTLPAGVEVVYVGLNPARARQIAASMPALQRPGLDLVFIDI